jgi:hypothetical protein
VKVSAKVRIAVGAEAGIATETIGVVGASAEAEMAVSAKAGIEVSVEAGIAVSTKAGIKVSAKAEIATAEKIRRTGLIIRVFGRFEVKVRSFGKS